MRKLLTFFMIVGLVACATSAANAQNLLTNGNFDLSVAVLINDQGTPDPEDDFFLPQPRNWVNDSSRTISGPFPDGLSSEPFANGSNTPQTNDGAGEPDRPDGCGADDCGVFFKPFQGGDPADGDLVTAHLFQDNPGVPGLLYILSGWAGAGENYSGLIPDGGTRTELALEFDNDNDRNNGSIATEIVELSLVGLGGNAGQLFGYDEFMVSAVAPAGTTVVRSRVSMIDAFSNPGGEQAFVVDDFTLVGVPEPTSLVLALLSVCGLVCLGRRR